MVGKQKLYSEYKQLCLNEGMKPISQAKFNERVKKLFLGVTEYKKTSPRRWRGLQFNPPEFDDADDFLS
jgi:hypothetical protein